MPVCFKKNWKDGTEVLVWKIIEDEHFFLAELNSYPFIIQDLEKIRYSSKRRQYLASRYLLKSLLGVKAFCKLKKTKRGKIYLPGDHLKLSLSHSASYAAVVVSLVDVGVDIQEFDQRLLTLSRKFVNENEFGYIDKGNPLLDYHLIWGAKESIFKAWGKGGLDFKKNMEISSPENNMSGEFQRFGRLEKGRQCRDYEIWNDIGDSIFLVVAREINRNITESNN